MAGRRRRKRLKSSDETIKDNRRVLSRQAYSPTYPDLPTELLELILSQLKLRDNIRASAVCKNWLAVATYVRKPNKPPWLMYVPKFDDVYEFYDPSNRKTYWHEFPELHGTRICYSKDGWLLLFRPKTVKKIIPAVVVSTCCPGDTEWTRVTYHNQVPFDCGIWNKMVFSEGLFYCLSFTGRLGVYDPEKRTWNVSYVPPPKCTEYFPINHSRRCRFIAEHNGDIFIIYAYDNVRPFMYKLDERKEMWLEMGFLGGVTLFANSLASVARTDFHGKIRNRVYFCKVLFYGKRCVTYSPDNGRYYPRKQNYDWREQDSCETVWIDAPEDLSTILER